MPQTVIVFVPGIMGTTLTAPHNIRTVWPLQVAEHPDSAVALLTQSDLAAGYVIEWITPKIDVYGGLTSFFAAAGYRLANAIDRLPDTTENVLVLTGYDWLSDNSVSAATVDATLTNVAAAYPGATIWLLAHSMGGLVSRYVIESGAFPNPSYALAGLITIATPHLGVPLALSAVTGEVNTNDLLNPQIIEQLVDWPALTSVFDMLPPSSDTFVFDADSVGYSIWDPSSPVYQLLVSAAGFAAPAAGFAAASAFTGALDYTASQNGRPDYYQVYGSTLATIQSFLYDPSATTPQSQLAQQSTTVNNGGDGTVPMTSASFTNGWSTATFDGGALTHGQLPNDATVLKQVLSWIAG